MRRLPTAVKRFLEVLLFIYFCFAALVAAVVLWTAPVLFRLDGRPGGVILGTVLSIGVLMLLFRLPYMLGIVQRVKRLAREAALERTTRRVVRLISQARETGNQRALVIARRRVEKLRRLYPDDESIGRELEDLLSNARAR